MKICNFEGCNYSVFSKGLCKSHWLREYGKPLKRTPLKKSVTKIVYICDKKKTQDEEYHRICEEMDAEARAERRWVCFFCGEPLGITADHHHTAGKTGLSDNNIPLYLDKEGIVLAHRACHRRYHDITIEELLKARYYKALMKKIYYLCKAKYWNMKAKHEEFSNK